MKASPVLSTPAPQLQAARHRQAFLLLRTVFVVAPVLFGLDKFTNLLTDWTMYLAPVATSVVPLPAQTIMHIVGVVEIVAGVVVAVRPRIGSAIVALWLLGIIINLLLIPASNSMPHYDVALRDLGLCLGALALGRLSHAVSR